MERSAFNDNYPLAQFGLTIIVAFCVAIILTIASMLIASPIFGMSIKDLASPEILYQPQNINAFKFLQLFQSIALFVVPSFILGKIFAGNSIEYLKLDKAPDKTRWALASIIILTAIPVINWIAELNSMIKLPDFMSGIQQYIDTTSKAYQTAMDAFMNISNLKGLAINLLVVALVPAIGEELLFRGILQRIFINWTRNIHWGIVIAAFIFSAFHFEFYGFFSRWLLGIMFGYMLVWTGSLWVPILAHFINNALAVIIYYLIHVKVLSEKMADVGANRESMYYTIICGIVSAHCMYVLYQKSRKVEESTKY
jgi:membrane protease YdiL (CAAX protease family)